MDKILITGANGFIGSNLCRYFADRGFEVHGLVRKTSDVHFLDGLPIHLVTGDLLEPREFELPEGIDYVVHSASLTSDLAKEAECEAGIFQVTANFLEKLLSLSSRPKRVIYISTTLTMGYTGNNISEENPGKSAEFLPYTRAKIKTEALVREKISRDGLPAIILRPGDVYGPNDRTTAVKLLSGRERGYPLIVGRGNAHFPYCYVEDLCQAVHHACLKPGIEGKTYTVTNDQFPTWRMFFSLLQNGIGKPQRVYLPVTVAWLIAAAQELWLRINPRYVPDVTFYRIKRTISDATYNMSKTIADLDFHPENNLERQVQAIIDWYREEKKKGYLR
jgi:nucleoside-diphosphate-sugar epimerase